MCGIAGFISQKPFSEGPAVLSAMTSEIHHRGPDAGRYYCEGRAYLGHRRLSIIDLAAGHQPMTSESGDLWLVYNGEIFNHADLRPELEQAGHRYVTHCDTETILHSYEQYGPACLNRFRGMFAFALWDKKSETLFCARDRLGIKPFYYYWDGKTFAFASEIKGLLRHPDISAAINESSLAEYLSFGYNSSEETLFANIRKLMPGHHLTLQAGQLKISRYWNVPEGVQETGRTEESWIQECRQRLEETVRMRLMSDVPLGMFLSGGVDSSAIAALMKRMVSGPVKSFSVGYEEAEFSELSYARQVAQSIGTDHHEVVMGMNDFFNALPKLVWHEDEPISWPSSVALYFVSRLASEQVKVVLTGEGSDELFAGYGRYRFYALNERWMGAYRAVPGAIRRGIQSWIGHSSLLSGGLRRKLQHTLLGRGDDLKAIYLDSFYGAFPAQELSTLMPSASPGAQYANFLRYWQERPDESVLSRMLYADQKTYLVELLMKQDQMSMACSIESRVPFLDHPFVEFAARVPDHMKLKNGVGKYIFKRAVEDLLPHDIIYRKKMGFPTPLRAWLMDPRSESLLAMLRDPNGLLASYLDLTQVEKLLSRHKSGLEDGTDRIWRLLNLQIWGHVFLTGKREQMFDPLLVSA